MADNLQQRAGTFFDEADTDHQGTLDKKELYRVCANSGCNVTAADIVEWFEQLDTNDDGGVSKKEFVDALNKIPPHEVKKCDLRHAFGQIDVDNSGSITLEELKDVLKAQGHDSENAVLDMDLNDDGKVNFEEFLTVFDCHE